MTLKQLQTPALCIALAAGVLAVFSQVIHFDFINVDDNLYVYQNSHVSGGLTWDGVGWAFTHAHGANWHPLTWLSHMLDCQLYGLRPGGHHFTNVLLHAANAVLLFLVLRRMTSAVWPSAFVAGLFALHPLRVESVAWVAERKDVLSGLFFMLTLWTYVRYTATRSWGRYAAVMLCFALGLMAKPMLVTLPFVLLLLDYWPLRRFQPSTLNSQPSTFLKLTVEKIPLLALSAVVAALTIWAQRQMGTIMTTGKLPLPWRLANAAVSYVVYLGQMCFPNRLAAYYPHPFDGLPPIEIFGAVLALMIITAAVIFWGRRFAYLPVGWFWYLGMLVPVIGLVQVGEQSHADRYTYLPQIGLYLIVAWGLAEIAPCWPRHRSKLVAAGGVCLVFLAVCAWRQTRYWKDPEVLGTHALACNPASWFVENFLADYLYEHGRLDEAIVHYQRTVRLSPNTARLHFNYGYALYQKSRLAEAQQEFEAVVQLNPDMADAHIGLGVVLYLQGKIEPAIQQYQLVLAQNPTHAAAFCNLGVVLESQGRMEEAIAHYRRALSINPTLADVHRNLARALLGRGLPAEAIPHYEQALKASPGDINLHSNLADALARSGQFSKATAELQQALALLGPGQEAVAQTLNDRLKEFQNGRLGTEKR